MDESKLRRKWKEHKRKQGRKRAGTLMRTATRFVQYTSSLLVFKEITDQCAASSRAIDIGRQSLTVSFSFH